MPQLIDIVKRGRRPSERFDRNKLRRSLVAACLSVRTPTGQAEDIADKACDGVIIWLSDRPVVTSADLRRKAADSLRTHHPEAAYLYSRHTHII